MKGKSLGVLILALVLVACNSQPSPAAPASGGQSPAGGGNVIVVTNTPTPAPKVPDNIPVMPNATDVNVTTSDISYVIKSDMQGVIDFYQKELPAKGWKEQEKPSILGDFGRLFYNTSTQQLSILLNASPTLNQVVIRMSIIGLNVVEGTATPKP